MSFAGFPKATEDYITNLSDMLNVWKSILSQKEIQDYQILIQNLRSDFTTATKTRNFQLLMDVSKRASKSHGNILLLIEQRRSKS